MGLDFTVLADYRGVLALGAWWTAVLTLAAAALSLGAGILVALALLHGPRWLALPVRGLAGLFMGTPLLLQLFLIYFGLAQLGIDIPVLAAGILGLGLHFAAYNAEVIRAGIGALEAGQAEAARSLGLSRMQAMRHVILPQALRDTAPPLGGNMIALLKESSLVSVIGITELVHAAQRGISETYRPFEFYIAAAAVYYVLNLLMEAALGRIERRAEASR
ncbi:MAG: amino acid ABC transporter permease [Geminicoccaceae bacterium]|nr:amino acid ABC transporter permease [Geminicoccaceae bacterium]